jgi:hypothetical protein
MDDAQKNGRYAEPAIQVKKNQWRWTASASRTCQAASHAATSPQAVANTLAMAGTAEMAEIVMIVTAGMKITEDIAWKIDDPGTFRVSTKAGGIVGVAATGVFTVIATADETTMAVIADVYGSLLLVHTN